LVSCDALSLTVNTTTDSSDANPGDAICADLIGDCSLRAAIQEANVYPGTDTINLPAGTYVLSIPGRDENAAASGDLDVLDGLKIIGNNAVIDGNDLDRVFDLRMGAVTLTGLTIIGGDNIDSGGGLSGGGGIRTLQSLTLKESTVTGNQSSGRSGGIEAGGTLLIINSTVSANSSGNSAGGIGANAQVTLVGSTVSGNTSVVGGGINSEQTLTLINSTVSDNNASFGAGVRNGNPGGAAAVFLRNSTIAGNSASSSGGGVLSFTSPIEARNTILAGNSGGTGADCSGTIVSQGYNLIQDLSGCTVSGDSTGNLTGVPAGLGPLASNGGPTSTRVLLPTSLARDAGNPALPGSGGNSCETTDQRGALRPTLVQGRCDIGAYEAPPANTCGNGIIEPTDSPANCDAGSAVVTVDPQGGSVQTPNERVTLSIPPGAVSTTTTLSITDTAPGAGLSLGAVTISARPHDQTFQEPVTFTFKWADRDNDGLVDLGACQEDETLTCDANGDCASNQCSVPSSNMDERSLVLRRNGQRFSSTGFGPGPYGCDDHLIDSSDCELAQASCADSPGTGLASVAACCNPMTNSWTFHTCSFSNDTAAPNTAGKVPGKGPVLTDCHAEWSPDLARLALDKQKGADGQRFPHYVQTCADGDDCDKDRLKDGVCTFEVLVAVNVGDVRLKDKRGVACAPTRVKKWKINSPKPDQLDVVMRNNALNMIDRVQCLATPDAVGCPKPLTSTVQGNTVSFIDAPVNRPDHETRLVQLRVPLRNPAAKKDPGRCQQDPKSCKRGTLGLRTQTVIVPSGADEALCLANADDKKCIKDNDKLNLICEPPLR
jgi:CSLREA domain-containing protein